MAGGVPGIVLKGEQIWHCKNAGKRRNYREFRANNGYYPIKSLMPDWGFR